MATGKLQIWVYAHWAGMSNPVCMGTLTAQQIKARKTFSFSYHEDWLQSASQVLLDPDLSWYPGTQYPLQKENFGIFLDSMPDTWGRRMMKRRSALLAAEAGRTAPVLHDTDYLLGVYDGCRMGGLRFKTDPDGPFLDNDQQYPVPPWSNIRELQQGAAIIESDTDNRDLKKWLMLLMAPGSSLGGARPKANIADTKGNLWIAKFPSANDTVNKAAWEFLAYRLACAAGVTMAESAIEKIAGRHHTFFTRRFDREKDERIHFASAMTMTGNTEDILRSKTASYLEIAEFIQFNSAAATDDLHQLWKRIVFNIAISNTDDHLRNHGFILTPQGWRLSPAFDINPSTDKAGLALNIDAESNTLDINVAKAAGKYFQLNETQMEAIVRKVARTVANWQKVAVEIGISRAEQEEMRPAFMF